MEINKELPQDFTIFNVSYLTVLSLFSVDSLTNKNLQSAISQYHDYLSFIGSFMLIDLLYS
jgi:hypothetical protein